jgi:CotS family spore coat protein
VWLIETDRGKVIVKKIPAKKEYLSFMIHAIDFLKAHGVRTPGVWKTATGADHVFFNGEYYVVFDAINGKKPKYKNEKELVKILQGMAQFHKASFGIQIPPDVPLSSDLEDWKTEYQAKLQKLVNWKEERSRSIEKNDFDRQFLQYIDLFSRQCMEALSILDQSCYQQWIESTRLHKTLRHQDFAAGNLILDENGKLNVFDMDSLTIDLPVRDMRRISNKVMRKQKKWDLELLLKMMRAYQEVNPLTTEQYKVFLADISFPHLFYGQVSKYYGNSEKEWTEKKHLRRFKEVIETELSKIGVLEVFQNRLNEVTRI